MTQRLPHLPTEETALNNSIREHGQAISYTELTYPKEHTHSNVTELKEEFVPPPHIVAWPHLSQEKISALVRVTLNEDLDIRSKV